MINDWSTFCWLVTDVEGSGSQWAGPPLGTWSWVGWGSRLSKLWEPASKHCSSVASASVPVSRFLPWIPASVMCRPNKPCLPCVPFGRGVYHSNRKQTGMGLLGMTIAVHMNEPGRCGSLAQPGLWKQETQQAWDVGRRCSPVYWGVLYWSTCCLHTWYSLR